MTTERSTIATTTALTRHATSSTVRPLCLRCLAVSPSSHPSRPPRHSRGIWARYAAAIYWSVTALKGTDNDAALTHDEKIVAIAVMIVGGGLLTIIIGEAPFVMTTDDGAVAAATPRVETENGERAGGWAARRARSQYGVCSDRGTLLVS